MNLPLSFDFRRQYLNTQFHMVLELEDIIYLLTIGVYSH